MSMLEKAVEIGNKIGVIATVEAAGPTTEGLLKQAAAAKEKDVDIETVVIYEAFKALQDGKEEHDRIIGKNQTIGIALRCDCLSPIFYGSCHGAG